MADQAQAPADNAQNFFNAHAAAQLAILPQFSNKILEDKFSGLAKVVNHKEGAQFNDAQTITHVRNAFRVPILDWFGSLKSLGVDIHIWNEIQERFEIDFEAVPSASSVVYKITEIKQADHKDVNEYFGRCINTMIEFKSKIPNTKWQIKHKHPPTTLKTSSMHMQQHSWQFYHNFQVKF